MLVVSYMAVPKRVWASCGPIEGHSSAGVVMWSRLGLRLDFIRISILVMGCPFVRTTLTSNSSNLASAKVVA
jgi:hypothetical protein